MKTARHISTMLLAAAVLLALPTLAHAKKVTYWQALEETYYSYEGDKWVKESSWKDTYKKNKLTSYTYTNYREWDSETQQYVDKKSTRKTTYKYNKQGKTASTTTYEDGKKTGKTVYSFNKKGVQTKYKTYNEKDKLVSTTTYKYNKNGTIKSITTTYKDKSKKTEKDTYSYKYYSKGVLKKRTIKHSSGTSSTYEYYKNGNTKKYTWKGTNNKRVEYYDKNGNETKAVYTSKNSEEVTTYTHNKKGLVTKAVEKWTNTYGDTKNTGTRTYTYEYETDKNGNVTSEIQYLDGEPINKTVYGKYKKFSYTVK